MLPDLWPSRVPRHFPGQLCKFNGFSRPDKDVLNYQFLARRGIMVPDQVSLLAVDSDQGFAWCDPMVTHIRWDYRPVVRRVLRWANNVAEGKEDRRQMLYESKLVEGGTMAAAKA